MARADIAKAKWQKNLARNVDKWAAMIQKSATFDEYVNNMANFLGISESAVRSSAPAQAYKDFQGNAGQLKSLLRSAATPEKAEKWLSNLKTAFGG